MTRRKFPSHTASRAGAGPNVFQIRTVTGETIAGKPTERSWDAAPLHLSVRDSDGLRRIPSGRETTTEYRAWSAVSRRPVASRWAALLNWSKRWIARIRSERQIRRGVDELMALDDRMLADIGLSRGDIAYGARYGRLPWRGPDGVHW